MVIKTIKLGICALLTIFLVLIFSANVSADITRISNRNSTFNGTTYFTGKVGIGTSSPQNIVDINGTGQVILQVKSMSPDYNGGIRISNDIDKPIDLNMYSSTKIGNRIEIIPYANLAEINTQADNFLIMTHYAKPIIFGIGLSEKMRIDGSGNVGIGTTSPDSKLTIGSGNGINELNISGLFYVNSTPTPALAYYGFVGIGTPSRLGTGSRELSVSGGTSGNVIADLILQGARNDGNTTFGRIMGMQKNSNATGTITFYRANDQDLSGAIAFNTMNNGANTEKMRIDYNGNVGIGTSSPKTKLEITDSTGDGEILRFSQSNNYYDFISKNMSGTSGQSSMGFNVNSNPSGGTAEVLTLKGNGYVGIGTTNPDRTLSVNGDANISGNLYANSNYVGIGTNNPQSKLHVNGEIRLTNQYATNLTQGFVIQLESEKNANIGLIENSYMRFSTNNAERMRITSDGKFGIGTTNPSQKLEVNGSANITGNITAGKFIGDGSLLTGINSSQWITSGINVYYNNGYVGIGTSTPGSLLTVASSSGANEVNLSGIFYVNSTQQGGYLGYVEVGSPLRLYTGNRELGVSAGTSGNVIADLVLQGTRNDSGPVGRIIGLNQNNTNAIGTISFNRANYQNNSGSITLNTMNNGVDTERMKIDYNGNVGIGTSNPSQKLEVNGNINITGAGSCIYFPSGGQICDSP